MKLLVFALSILSFNASFAKTCGEFKQEIKQLRAHSIEISGLDSLISQRDLILKEQTRILEKMENTEAGSEEESELGMSYVNLTPVLYNIINQINTHELTPNQELMIKANNLNIEVLKSQMVLPCDEEKKAVEARVKIEKAKQSCSQLSGYYMNNFQGICEVRLARYDISVSRAVTCADVFYVEPEATANKKFDLCLLLDKNIDNQKIRNCSLSKSSLLKFQNCVGALEKR